MLPAKKTMPAFLAGLNGSFRPSFFYLCKWSFILLAWMIQKGAARIFNVIKYFKPDKTRKNHEYSIISSEI